MRSGNEKRKKSKTRSPAEMRNVFSKMRNVAD